MMRISQPDERRRPFIIALSLAVVVMALGITAQAFFNRAQESVTPGSRPPQAQQQPQNGSDQIRIGKVEPVTLTREGFEPREIRRSKGDFLLAINNRSGVQDAGFDLLREGGGGRENIRAIRMLEKKRQWREVVDFPPGEYILTTSINPKWTCRITILPRN